MRLDVKHPPEHWEVVLGIDILDPDGWRDAYSDWNAEITRADFLDRAARSTTSYPQGFFADLARSVETFKDLSVRRCKK